MITTSAAPTRTLCMSTVAGTVRAGEATPILGFGAARLPRLAGKSLPMGRGAALARACSEGAGVTIGVAVPAAATGAAAGAAGAAVVRFLKGDGPGEYGKVEA